MNEIQLAQLFVDYAEALKVEQELRLNIEEAVLELGESRVIAGVRATYYNPSFGTPDYEAIARNNGASPELIAACSETKVVTKWQKVCDLLNAQIPRDGELKPARVVVKAV